MFPLGVPGMILGSGVHKSYALLLFGENSFGVLVVLGNVLGFFSRNLFSGYASCGRATGLLRGLTMDMISTVFQSVVYP